MEMFQVRYVLAAARHLNFTKAAADCAVSQPALTKAIAAIETELGAQLFHRDGKRILVSEFGRSLLPHFLQIMEQAATTRTLADNWTVVTADGSLSAHYELTIAVTEHGPWVLSEPYPFAQSVRHA